MPKFKAELDVKGFENLKGFLDELMPEFDKGVESIAETALKTLQTTTPGAGKPEARLANLYELIKKRDTRGFISEATVINTTDNPELIWMLERGTKPHVITGNDTLVFQIDGQIIFTHEVNHPGTRPYLFIQAAEDEAEASLAALVARTLEILKEKMA